ncbi:unnamed protein product [Caenorhabditis brenneri]
MEDARDTQFDMTIHEESLQELREKHGEQRNRTFLFRSFWPLMTAYADYVILPQLNAGVRTTHILFLVKKFFKVKAPPLATADHGHCTRKIN